MTTLYLLPGNSKVSNEEWIKSIAKTLSPMFDNIKIHTYRHWDNGEDIADMGYESSQLENNFSKDSIIFAKSIGVLIALKAIAESKVKPSCCIFLGTPVSFARKSNIHIEFWIKSIEVPTLFIQNSNDPAISANELRGLIERIKSPNFTLEELPGNSHDYSDLKKIKGVVKLFLSKNANS